MDNVQSSGMGHSRRIGNVLARTRGQPLVMAAWTAVTKKSEKEPAMSTISVRYIVVDVDAAIAFYTRHLGFGVDLLL